MTPDAVSSSLSATLHFLYRGKGPALVLIHGMFGDLLDWEPVLEPLAESHRVIAVDLPGFGASSKPPREYSADFFVSTLHESLALRSLRRAADPKNGGPRYPPGRGVAYSAGSKPRILPIVACRARYAVSPQ
jgi:pimeloyl-ACP methyl ester carboxylesterase